MTRAETYALCAVVAMQKYLYLDAINWRGIGHAYRVLGWHDVMEFFALECLKEHQAVTQ